MASRLPIETPWGSVWSIDLPSLVAAAGAWLLLTLAGLALTALFYQLVAKATFSEKIQLDEVLRRWPRQSLHVMLFTLLWSAITFFASIPFSCLASLSLGALGSLAGIVFFGFLVALLFPLLFTAHAIVTEDAHVVAAVLRSARLVRITLPLTSLLFIGILLLSQVLDSFWRIPAEDSWVTLFAIGGHAFATTGLLATTFIYYRRASQWVQALWQSIPRD